MSPYLIAAFAVWVLMVRETYRIPMRKLQFPAYAVICWILLMLAAMARGQPATQPTTRPVAVWFQPSSNLQLMADLGVTHVFGPELENPPKLTMEAWSAKCDALGMKVVLKLGADKTKWPATLPGNCAGILISVDEPNGKGIAPATVKAEYDALSAKYPDKMIFLSLAGDKITSANLARPAERKLLEDYMAACDAATINTYSANRNATRYPMSWTGDCVKKLKTITDKPVLAWIECSDQQLPEPPAGQGSNRGPTAQEMRDTVKGVIEGNGDAIGWFATASNGWAGWPASFWTGVVTAEQQQAVKEITFQVAGPRAPPASSVVTNADLKNQLDRIEAKLDKVVETVVPVYNGCVWNRDKANADPLLRPFTWLPSEHWRNEKKADWWKSAQDYWAAVNKPTDPNYDPLYSQRIRLAGRIAAQSGAPVNLDHELAGGDYSAEQIGWIAEHVRIFRGGAGIKLPVGVYDVWCVGRPFATTASLAAGDEAKAKAAIEQAAPLWKEVDYVLIDAYLWEGDNTLGIQASQNAIRYIKKFSGKPCWVYVAGRLKNGGNTFGGVVSPELAKKHAAALIDAGADALVLFGDYAEGKVYLEAVKK